MGDLDARVATSRMNASVVGELINEILMQLNKDCRGSGLTKSRSPLGIDRARKAAATAKTTTTTKATAEADPLRG